MSSIASSQGGLSSPTHGEKDVHDSDDDDHRDCSGNKCSVFWLLLWIPNNLLKIVTRC